MTSAQTPSDPATTRPVPADQAAPLLPSRSALADIALATGIPAKAVNAYVAHQAAFLSAPYRFVATIVGLQAVGS